MAINITYIISQILTIIMFICLGKSYFCKNRKEIIVLNIFAQLFQSVASFLLKGFTGMLMSYVMLISNVILFIEYEKKSNKTRNIIVLVFLLIMVVYGAFLSYNGLLSLLSVIATIILLFGVWQENIKKYIILGLISSFFWLLYYLYLESLIAIILEIVLIICMIISLRHNSLKKIKENTQKC